MHISATIWSCIVVVHLILFQVQQPNAVAYRVPPHLSHYPVLILPGFGNDAIDYVNPGDRGYHESFQHSLHLKGLSNIEVLPIKRYEWLNILKGLFLLSFWRCECQPSELFQFYFKAVQQKVRDMERISGRPVLLVAHSAGGWLARGIMGDGVWVDDDGIADGKTDAMTTQQLIAGLITLGAPHIPPKLKSSDMTRGALSYVHQFYPGAYLSSPELGRIGYVSVGGSVVKGNITAARGSIEKFAGDSYYQLTGDSNMGSEFGDGLVPLSAIHLEGALQITLPDVWHSINAPQNMWYGNADVVDQWLPQAIEHLQQQSGKLV